MNYYNCALLLPMFTQPCDVTPELISMSSYNTRRPTQANVLLTSCCLPLGISVKSSFKSSSVCEIMLYLSFCAYFGLLNKSPRLIQVTNHKIVSILRDKWYHVVHFQDTFLCIHQLMENSVKSLSWQ